MKKIPRIESVMTPFALSVEIGDVPPHAAVIKVYVEGTDADRRPLDACGAVSVRPSS